MTRDNPKGFSELSAEARSFVERVPDACFVEAFIIDINGIARGKRVPLSALGRLYAKGLCLPASTALLDIWGREVEATGLVMASGDADHVCYPVADTLRELATGERAGGQVFLHMHAPGGTPFIGDSRTQLQRALAAWHARGLTPVVATELEFRLFEPELDDAGRPRPASDASGPGRRSQLYGLDELGRLDAVFADIDRVCAAQDVPLDTLIAEQSAGQYEINLAHTPDALRAADDTIRLKRAIKACARNHGLAASFMAKPFGDGAGNGMHVHVSACDGDGDNVFSAEQPCTEALMQGVAGLLDTMADATALWAPHANSYRRFQPNSHAPLAATWGRDNRTTAVRLPLAEPAAARIEHRVAGADANPYLVLAAVLAGIEHGWAKQLTPPAETQGGAEAPDAQRLPDAWGAAIERFERSDFIADALGGEYQRWFAGCKRQERETLRRSVPASEYDIYLQSV